MSDALPAGFIAIPHDASAGAVLVGFSGGLDSSVLLHLLAGHAPIRERGLRAIHVHHGLQAEADAWAAHCRVFCETLAVPLQVVRVEVDRSRGSGPEAAARDARRHAFAQALGDGDILALAHHRDDQAETFLLRALRASGPDGLAAMRPWRRSGEAWLWRPLLELPRTVLLEHARRHDLRWIEDPSNADITLDRNFLRRQVLPLLRGRWPHADASFARSATLSARAHDLLADGDEVALASSRTIDPRVLSVAALRALPRDRRARVLRRWTAALALPPLPAQGVARIESDLMTAATGDDAAFRWQGAAVRRWRDLLHAGPSQAPLPRDWRVQWDGRTPLLLPDDARLRLDGAGNEGFGRTLQVHARQGGERIVLPGRHHSHALKHVLQDLGVPPWQREQLPLLADAEGNLLAAGGLVHSAAFDAWLRAHDARLCWMPA
jgi:tRNA(Ile)-lysidine synthase